MKEITFENAQKTQAHYSPAILSSDGSTVYVSGQLPIDPATRNVFQGDIKEQTRIALENVEKIICQAGGTKESILRTTAYIDEMENWDAVNEVYADFFGERKPARTIVCVNQIHFGLKVEIDAVAEVKAK